MAVGTPKGAEPRRTTTVCSFIPAGVILSVPHARTKCPRCSEPFADHYGVTVEVASSVPPNMAYLRPADAKWPQ